MDRVEPTFGRSRISPEAPPMRIEGPGSAEATATPQSLSEATSTSHPNGEGTTSRKSPEETTTAVTLIKSLVSSVAIVTVILSVFVFFYSRPSPNPPGKWTDTPEFKRAAAEMERRYVEMRPYVVEGISARLCESYENVIRKAVELRRSGVPMDTAIQMANPAMRQNRDLWDVISTSIKEAYRDPDNYDQILRMGWWTYTCTAVLNGYRY